jgi:hypothetical protein
VGTSVATSQSVAGSGAGQPPPTVPAQWTCRYNPDIRPGRTIVVGTEQGLHARYRTLELPAFILRSTTDDGAEVVHSYDLADQDALAAEAQRGGFWSYGERCMGVHAHLRCTIFYSSGFTISSFSGLFSSTKQICI